MIPKQAIEKAIEGGWRPFSAFFVDEDGQRDPKLDEVAVEDGEANWDFPAEMLVCRFDVDEAGWDNAELGKPLSSVGWDPSFWQCLGKALGWGKHHEDGCWSFLQGGKCDCGPKDNEWEHQAHRFYDLILTGGDTDAFWDTLLKV